MAMEGFFGRSNFNLLITKVDDFINNKSKWRGRATLISINSEGIYKKQKSRSGVERLREILFVKRNLKNLSGVGS